MCVPLVSLTFILIFVRDFVGCCCCCSRSSAFREKESGKKREGERETCLSEGVSLSPSLSSTRSSLSLELGARVQGLLVGVRATESENQKQENNRAKGVSLLLSLSLSRLFYFLPHKSRSLSFLPAFCSSLPAPLLLRRRSLVFFLKSSYERSSPHARWPPSLETTAYAHAFPSLPLLELPTLAASLSPSPSLFLSFSPQKT